MQADLRIPFPFPLVIKGGSNLPEGKQVPRSWCLCV